MKKFIFLSFAFLLLAFSQTAFGQFDALNKITNKVKEVTGKTAPRGANGSGKSNDAGASSSDVVSAVSSGRTPANSGVEIVLAKADYKTFAEAKPHAVNRITDGEPLWMYVKFNGTLANYAHKATYADSEGNINYFLFVEIGARGETLSYNDASLIFKKEQLNVSELKIALAPGVAGTNKSLPIFLKTVGGGQPGVWNNEIRISKSPVVPRSAGDYLAKAEIVCDVSDGVAKYRKMEKEYRDTVYRGTAEENKLPEPGKFVNAAIKNQILAKLKDEGITVAKFFFSDDDWAEYSDSQTGVKTNRTVYAAYTYQKGAECLSGVAEVVQNYSYGRGGYGETLVYLRKGFPIQCSLLK